jgi:hypothetical protein
MVMARSWWVLRRQVLRKGLAIAAPFPAWETEKGVGAA